MPLGTLNSVANTEFVQVVNGLLSREDIEQRFKQIPIGVIPAGSDNSLCWSVMGVRDPSAAALAIVKVHATSTN